MQALRFIHHYPETLVTQVRHLVEQGKLRQTLERRYPQSSHAVQTDAQLYEYVQKIKAQGMRSAGPLAKVCYDAKMQLLDNALGQNRLVSRVQGQRLKSKQEIRIASLLKQLPEPLLRMVVVHELAHLREKEHNKAFYQLCEHMEPQYHLLEFDLRLFLVLRDLPAEA